MRLFQQADTNTETCYWYAWCDCSGSAIKDCNGNCPSNSDFIGNEGTFGRDACGECGGDGMIYGASEDCCETDVDKCNNCFGPCWIYCNF